MPFGSEVTAKLGVDTASVPADLAKAGNAFKQFGKGVEDQAAEHGAGAGTKLTNALEHKILGARHLSGALATALGLNIENIAHGITAAIVGGSIEGFKQMGEQADAEAKLIEKKIELALTPKGLQEKIKKDLARSQADLAGKKGESTNDTEAHVDALSAQIPILGFIAEKLGVVRSEEEKRKEIGEATVKVEEADNRVLEQNKAVKESHRKLAEYELDLTQKNFTGTQLLEALAQRRADLQEEIKNGKLSELEIDERKKHYDDLGVQAEAERNRLKQVGIDKEKELLRLQGSLVEAQRKLAKDEADLANKKADRGKLTVDEIANLKAGKTGTQFGQDTHVDTFGLSEEAAKAKETAAEIQRMQKQAEGLRQSGDSGGANDLLDQIGVKKQSLVDSGFAKSTEGDDMKQLSESIHKDNAELQKILNEIKSVAQGKIKNE